MGIFSNIFAPPEIRMTSEEAFKASSGLLSAWPFANFNGTVANTKSAFTISAFYNAVDQISNDIAKLPKHIYKKEGEKRYVKTDHPANYLISAAPNNLMTAFDFWKIITISTIIKGNGYAEIIRNKVTGKEEAFIFRNSDNVEVYAGDNVMYYKYKGRAIDSENMLHFKGFSFDGILGVGIITFAAQQLGIMLDGKKYQGDIYKDRGLAYGVLESELSVDPKNKKIIEDGFAAKMSSGNKFRTPLLDEGFKYKSITITPQEAEFLATDKNAVIEICRWLNIAPHKLKHLDNATFTNIQHQSIEHVQDSLLPWVTRDEQELNRKLFSVKDRNVFYSKFNEKFLLRGDLEARKNFYTAGIYSGFFTRNEVRALEDMDPIEGLDEPLQPANMQALSMATQLIEEQKNSSNGNNNS
jgi:HK97 family phage portal protein